MDKAQSEDHGFTGSALSPYHYKMPSQRYFPVFTGTHQVGVWGHKLSVLVCTPPPLSASIPGTTFVEKVLLNNGSPHPAWTQNRSLAKGRRGMIERSETAYVLIPAVFKQTRERSTICSASGSLPYKNQVCGPSHPFICYHQNHTQNVGYCH